MKYAFLFNEIFRIALVERVQVCLTLVRLVKVCPALLEQVHVRPGLMERCQTTFDFMKWQPKTFLL